MNMNKIYINERSLEGQFKSFEDFLEKSMNFISCLEWLRKNKPDFAILKKSDLYESQITEKNFFYELRGFRASTEKNTNDVLRKLKSSLLALQNNPPFWDMQEMIQKGNYFLDGVDITNSSIAEAAATEGQVLSFDNRLYKDTELSVVDAACEHSVYSIGTIKGMAKILYESNNLEIDDFLKLYFRGTRLNFKYLEDGYGLKNFEKTEIQDCIKNFIRFSEHKNWSDIYSDQTLAYKSYKPSDKDNWFRESEYRDKTIDKFRCRNPKRCFGFKEKDIFYVLRIERDHKISDRG